MYHKWMLNHFLFQEIIIVPYLLFTGNCNYIFSVLTMLNLENKDVKEVEMYLKLDIEGKNEKG